MSERARELLSRATARPWRWEMADHHGHRTAWPLILAGEGDHIHAVAEFGFAHDEENAELIVYLVNNLERLLAIEATLAVIRELAQRPSERSSGEPPEKILGRIWSRANRALSIPEAGR